MVAALSSEKEKGEVSIGRVSDTGKLGRVQLSGTLALLPRRFSKWLYQFSKRFLAQPPFILTDDHEFLPERYFIVFYLGKVMLFAYVFFRKLFNFSVYKVKLSV